MKPERPRSVQPELPFPIEISLPPPRRKKRRVKRRTRGATALAAVLLAAGAILIFRVGRPTRPSAETTEAPPGPETPPWTMVEENIDKGETLSKILLKYGLSAAEIDRLVKEVKPVFDFKKIKAGRKMKLSLDLAGGLHALEYPTDERTYVLVTNEGGAYAAAKKDYPFEKRVTYLDGVIEDSLYEAVVGRKESPALSWLIEELFGWDVDFWAGLRRGDAFRAVFEKYYIDGKFADYGEILAAEFWNQGDLYQAFRFEYPDTKKADHFDSRGGSLRKEFLKSPLKGYRITSRFSFSRLHPIRRVWSAHYGVDYGAPEGSPVFATAEGTVLEAGWNGASGRLVRLKHKNNFETMYLHLARILVRKGDKVKSGQEIGTVGQSGEATGPHLDYRIKERGSYVNPLSKKFSPVEPLRPAFREAFNREVEKYRALLDAPFFLFRR
jgi:murein DD-endopeptidase MepM/ murein hydrolase activator NlpD